MTRIYSALLFLLCCSICTTFLFAQKTIRANPDRMQQRIDALGKFGTNPQGGVSRVAFSEADIEARAYMMGLMEAAGLDVAVDAAGNITGRRAGKNNSLPAILFGSHIDSVPEGGNYDGDVGVIGALECIELLNENDLLTEHPLEMVIFSDEEGGLTGSQAMSGGLEANDLDRVSNSGKTIRQGIDDIGGDAANFESARRSKEDFLAYLELHIEQGGILDEADEDIGVVEGIVGIEQWQVIYTGKANHAGTTPMDKRSNALIAASHFVIAVDEQVRDVPGTQVGTVGVIKAEPGAPNVIPGKVTMTLEMRDLSREKMMGIYQTIAARAEEIANSTGTTLTINASNLDIHPALANDDLKALVAASTEELGFSYRNMPSFAGHDAQDLAKITRMAMIFVPSKDGISHSPDEYTSPQDMANGASVLLRTILKLDARGK